MTISIHASQYQSRLTGFLFVFFCIPLAIWGLGYVSSKIMVPGDPVQTALQLLAHERMFRWAIASHLASTVIFTYIIWLLHRHFALISKNGSQLMFAAALIQLPVVMLLEVVHFSALITLKTGIRESLHAAHQQEIAYFLLRIHRTGMAMAQLFFGLSFIPFGMVVLKSRYIPRIFGLLLIMSGIGYVTDCFTFLLLQRPDYLQVRKWVVFTFSGFPLTMLWILVKGMKTGTGR